MAFRYLPILAPQAPAAEPAFKVVLSANIATGGEATTSYGLTAPAGKTGADFTAGQRRDDANTLTFTPSGADKWTKVALALQPNAAGVSNGQVYKFRLVLSTGAVLDTYSVTPTWTIGTPVVPMPPRRRNPLDREAPVLTLPVDFMAPVERQGVPVWWRVAGVAHAATGSLAAQDAAIAGAAAHLTLHATSGALAAQAATISGTAAHHHAAAGVLAAQDATIAGTATHLTLHATSGALDAQSATIAGQAAHHHATTGALAAADAAIAGTAANEGAAHATSGALSADAAAIAGTAAHQHATSGALAADAATIAGTAAHFALHATSGALAAQAAAIAGVAAHQHAASGALAAVDAAISGSADHSVPGSEHATSGALAAADAALAGVAAHLTLHTSSGALAAQGASVAGDAAHLVLHTSSGALAADAATVAGVAEHVGDEPTRVHGFEMGGDEHPKRRRNLVTIIRDVPPDATVPRPTITKAEIDRKRFERARDEAREAIAAAATAHAAAKHTKAERFAQVRTTLKPLAKALGDWNWITLYQRMYQDALDAALRQEIAREDAIEAAAAQALDDEERAVMELFLEWM